MKIAFAVAALALMTCPAMAQDMVTPPAAEAPNTTAFAPGQVWTLKDPAFAGARLIVDKVEMLGEQHIVHISLTDVPPGVSQLSTFAHLPFSEDAVRQSVDALAEPDGQPYPGFAAGYAQWQAAKGGVFTVPVPDVIGLLNAALHAPPPDGQRG